MTVMLKSWVRLNPLRGQFISTQPELTQPTQFNTSTRNPKHQNTSTNIIDIIN